MYEFTKINWNKNTKIKYIGRVSLDNELLTLEKSVNDFLKEKGDRVKDVRMTSTVTVGNIPYISFIIIYDD